MTGPPEEAKRFLRRSVLAEWSRLTPLACEAQSVSACNVLRHQSIWQTAQSILFYAPMQLELDVWPLVLEALTLGKMVSLPRYLPGDRIYEAAVIADIRKDLRAGKLAIREPADHCFAISLKQLDLILVPGVAFDRDGRRLGRGKGFYDRLLSPVTGIKCGVGFDFQVKEQLPEEPHDVRLDCIMTPTRWLIAGCEAV